MKTALITGANKSIGFETAKVLLKNGYYVYLGSRDLQRGQQAVDTLKAEGLTAVEVLQIDVADEQSVQQAKENLSQKTQSLDVLINNAGILGSYDQKASDVSLATVREVYDTNFFGVIQVTQAFLPLVQKSDQGVIVNVTSGLGSLTLHSDPNWKHYHVKTAAYGTSKTALNAYSVVLAYELRDTPVKVNVVDPGYTATDFNNNQGPLKVEDSAAFVAQYAMIGPDGPTGKFFSHDYAENNNESPW